MTTKKWKLTGFSLNCVNGLMQGSAAHRSPDGESALPPGSPAEPLAAAFSRKDPVPDSVESLEC